MGALAGAAADSALRDPSARPAGLFFGVRRAIAERFEAVASSAPAILHCDEFFVVPRARVQKVQLEPSGELVVMTADRAFRLAGDAEALAKAKGFLAFRGYPG